MTIELEKIKLAAQQKFSRAQLELIDPKIILGEVDNDFIRDMLTTRLTGYVYGERGEAEVIEHPADWWEAFKERWFPEVLLRSWPVRWRQYTITPTTFYPNFRISMPSVHHVLRLDVTSTTRTDAATDEF